MRVTGLSNTEVVLSVQRAPTKVPASVSVSVHCCPAYSSASSNSVQTKINMAMPKMDLD